MNKELLAAAKRLIREALKEDLGSRGDITTRFLVPTGARLSGAVVAKAPGVICGTEIAREVFRRAAPGCRIEMLARDGAEVRTGQAVMKISGGRAVLSAERTALNFLQRLSGIATATRGYVERVRGTRAKIYDTRKTLPGWRILEKYAVRCGGGLNHRMGLHDAVLVKDNHWTRCPDMASAVRALRRRHPRIPVELEAASLAQVEKALASKPDIILLDNMSRAGLKKVILLVRAKAPSVLIEISGGVSLEGLRSLAELGPDRISVGRITHSAPALDLSLEIE
ncbi:MAG: carboxylating nicotinate-nucleotide diphosphorylase [Elusimicrobia bacterium]|nr:carboxylating nicotinate-nucleotide diphosphorylase [Elusimicrobiota bacterium]